MKDFLLYLWQLPQSLLGLILTWIWPAEHTLDYKGVLMRFNKSFPSGISLGRYVILKRYPYNKGTWNDVKHEYSHTVQSKKWGWLYLVVIGLPSLCGNIIDRLSDKGSERYYNLPWEKDADEKGGVVR